MDELTSHVDWSVGGVKLLTESREWEAVEGRPRRAGVSSFGVSGTNAHVILEEAGENESLDDAPEPLPEPSASGALPWLVSAAEARALTAQAVRIRDEAARHHPRDVAHTLATGRSSLTHRAVVVGSDHEELLRGVTALAQGEAATHVVLGDGTLAEGRVAFVFP
ncbi:ketoacyl-synthetase C-terminal extension domain-containing protein, partial [Nocardiopsis listeri]|uniref:ketoacyl-synthetase C-terminal extension domain-containing protein n=1 Tax=Nocardiopsis listeri TaxID=53440 RepID=UPI0027391A4E